jgi:hypothetical protein
VCTFATPGALENTAVDNLRRAKLSRWKEPSIMLLFSKTAWLSVALRRATAGDNVSPIGVVLDECGRVFAIK